MPTAVVVGGGVAGLVAALALRPLGYDVQVLDREADAAPESVDRANSDWVRPTVPQALHSHSFTSLGIGLLRDRDPGVYDALLQAGAEEIDLRSVAPPALRESLPDMDDTELLALACRRRTFDSVLATTARRSGVVVRHDATVRGVELSEMDTPRVTGVRLADHGTLAADLVLDATGRHAESRRWLTAAGIPVATDQAWPSEATVYTRFYRRLGAQWPGLLNRGNAGGGIFGHYMAFVHPGDNGTFSVSIGVLPDDPVLKAVRGEAAFTAVLAATPLLAPWIAEGASEPISTVYAINAPKNTVRGVATTRQRPVHGLFQLGDAACTTNPLYGRGVSLAVAHAYQLADVLAGTPEVGEKQSILAAELTETLLVPWVRQAADDDLERIRVWRTAVHGEQFPPLDTDRLGLAAAARASFFDAEVWYRLARVLMSLGRPEHFYGDPALRARVRAALDGRTLPAVPAPGRAELVEVIEEAGR